MDLRVRQPSFPVHVPIVTDCVTLRPSKTLWGSWARKPFCLPFLVAKTPASMTFSRVPKGRFKQLLIKRGAAKKPSAGAESLQSCPTLCDPIDGSPPGFPVPGILQARTLEWAAIAFSEKPSEARLKELEKLTKFRRPNSSVPQETDTGDCRPCTHPDPYQQPHPCYKILIKSSWVGTQFCDA